MASNEYRFVDGTVDQSNLGSTIPRDVNFGVYGQIGGTSISISLGTDGVTVGLSGQLSIGYSVSGTTSLNRSWDGQYSVQPSFYQGVGTPSGWPGLTTSAGFSPDGKSTQIQLGLGVSDVVEGGFSFSFTDKDAPVTNPETSKLLSQYPNFGVVNLRPTMVNDPRRLDNPTSSQSSTYTGGVAFVQYTATRTAAAQAESNAALSALLGTTAPTDPTLGGLRDYMAPPAPVETYTFTSSYTPPASTDSTESNMCRASDYSSTSSESPIVIDLNGDGVQLNPLGSSHANFDFDNDGYREATAWAGPQDGILVIDEGGDGVVTQAKEIAFSQWTTANGDTDLQALAATFDSNHDGVLDANDARFSDFKVWRDANGDGVSDAGEMQTLTQAGIQSMNLTVKSGTGATLADGTQVFGLTDVQRTDGSIVQAADVAFAYNTLGYRTKIDANGNTVSEFESGTTLNYRNIAATATGAAANFNLGTDTDTTLWIGATGNAAANVLDASAKTSQVLLDGGAGDDTLTVVDSGVASNTIKKIATYAVLTGARGRFVLKFPANAYVYAVAA
jgi:hypothetical protein